QSLLQSQPQNQVPQKVVEDSEARPIWERAARRRMDFASLKTDALSAAASNIDEDVQLNTRADFIRYIPRAAVIGFFAPFPNMWLNSGTEVGISGRILVGLETLLTYAIECFALAGLWRGRRELSAWLLFTILTIGAIGLGLVV